MQSIRNFRDLGGIPSAYGSVKKHKLLRGGPLNTISEEDKHTLLNHNALSLVVDFRNTHEINNERNIKLEKVMIENIKIMPDENRQADPNAMIDTVSQTESSDFMFDIYAAFVLQEHSRKAYKKFIEKVAESSAQGSIYFHCTAGKDRTGFASALLLKILGVSKEEIYKDFLKTNDNIQKDKGQLLQSIQKFYPFDEQDEALLLDVLGVRKEYLDKSFEAIHNEYGSFDNFVTTGLELQQSTIDTLRHNLLEL